MDSSSLKTRRRVVTDTNLTLNGGDVAETRKDIVRDRLREELRAIRRSPGLPSIDRIAGQDTLVDVLGDGDLVRAWVQLGRLYDDHGKDPETDIGAYFYLAGWEVGLNTVERRATRYAEQFAVDERTAIRRADRGLRTLADLVRDLDETARPWGLITLFQSGPTVDVIVRLMLAYESWRPAVIQVNGDDISDPDFTLHRDQQVVGGYYHQIVLKKLPLNLDVVRFEPMLSVRVHWPMPIWPTWQARWYIADRRLAAHARTFRDRTFEMQLEWTQDEAVQAAPPLARDERVWV
ncbi:hypothetical protein HWD35_18990 [Tsukamurella tyrosinosolvens]|uniref:hypothetical protein n=1 Tax=Tsukamurella tyrosinosolvens TaxID=57704 RepID=UPI001CE1CCD8|nr:hypothetical protein [Tsukamurella tyrosinosolvens]MCA4996806.1 hypothetical protein [Tsukamurella tyrosinosolvens]